MAVHAEVLANTLEHAGVRNLPLNAQLFRAYTKLYAGGGGSLVEIDVEAPPEQWLETEIPRGRFAINAADGAFPLLIGDDGVLHALQADGSLHEIYRVGTCAESSEISALPQGRILISTMRSLSGMYLVNSEGRTLWRKHSADTLVAVLADRVFTLRDRDPSLLIAIDVENGRNSWQYRVRDAAAAAFVGLVDDTVWVSNGMTLTGLDIQDGSQRAVIDTGVHANIPRLTPEGYAHLVFGQLAYWLLDLRAGAVIGSTRVDATAGSPYAMECVSDGSVVIRDRSYCIYRIPGLDSDASPVAVWTAPSRPVSALVHRNGLLVLIEPHGRALLAARSLHWLAPDY